MKGARRFTLILLAALAAVPAEAAYHYVHYLGNFTPVYEKFNLTALPNNTVSFFVDDQGPAIYAANDSFGSVLAQIRAAAAAWNSVSASALRVAYAGLESYTSNPTVANPGSPIPGSATPGGDVIFVDTPGLLGMGAPTTSTVLAQSATGPYFPIVRGLVMLSRDTSNPSSPGPSYTEKYFTTAVHEIGHALGLQHTWTSSAMSQDVIRNTSRARPLDADDMASLAVLYGNTNWTLNYGSISGRVTFATGGAGVALASVVAISPTGPAVSTLTNPDGTYRIDGLPPNYSYLVYAHPLPPDAVPADNSGLRLPVDQNGNPYQPGGSFVTGFSQGGGITFDPTSASSYAIGAGLAVGNVNFTVTPRTGVTTYDVQTYSRMTAATRTYTWPGDTTITGYPGFMETTGSAGLVIAEAATPAVLPTPQSVTLLGVGSAPLNPACTSLPAVCPYPGQPIMAIYLALPPNSSNGPRHLVFNFGNDIYVLPSAVDLVQKGPPVINSVAVNGDGSVSITGAGFGPDSRVFFDGLQTAQGVFSGADAQGTIVVTPPPAAAGQVSTIAVYNSDGQNSMILPPANLPQYTYASNAAPQIAAITPAALPAGASAAIDITAFNTNFLSGQVSVGFGSDDVTASRVWVLSPTHLIVNVVVAPNAALISSEVSIVSGMQVASQPGAFQVQPARAGVPLIALPVSNAIPSFPGLYAASYGAIYGQNLGASPSAVQVTLNNQAAPVYFASSTQIDFFVPSGFTTGPATLNVTAGGASAFPVLVQVDNPPPNILTVNNAPAATPATVNPGETVTITVSGLDPTLLNGFLGRLQLTVAGLPMAVQQVTAQSGGVFQIQAVMTQSFGSSQVPLAVVVDGSASVPMTIVAR